MNPGLLLRALTACLVAALPAVFPPVFLAGLLAISPASAQTTLDKVSFGTNWVAEAEHGGFF